MKFKLVLLMAVLLLSSTTVSAQTVSSLFSCNGNNYTITFSDRDFVETPSWNPEKEDAPLSIRKALEIARVTLNRCHPKANDNWSLWKIELNPMGKGKWVYELEFVCPYGSCANNDRHHTLYIRLNGTVILPKEDAQPTEKLDVSNNPIPLKGTVVRKPQTESKEKLYNFDNSISSSVRQDTKTPDCKRFPGCQLSEYTKVIESNPTDAIAYLNRGIAYYVEKKFDDSLSDFTKVIKLDSKSASAYGWRGSAYSRKKEYELAIADYDKAIELEPQNANYYNNRGAAYSGKGYYDKAVADYNKAIELVPDEWLYYYVRGWIHYNNGKKSLAEADFKKAKELETFEENPQTVKIIQPSYPNFPK